MNNTENFRIAWSKELIGIIAILFAPILWYAWPEPIIIATVIAQLLITIAILGLPIILSIGESGLTWCGLVKIPWDNIQSVQLKTIIGLPYLVIKRNKGIRWF